MASRHPRNTAEYEEIVLWTGLTGHLAGCFPEGKDKTLCSQLVMMIAHAESFL